MSSIYFILYLQKLQYTCVDPDPYSEYGSGSTKLLNTDPIRIRIHKTASNYFHWHLIYIVPVHLTQLHKNCVEGDYYLLPIAGEVSLSSTPLPTDGDHLLQEPGGCRLDSAAHRHHLLYTHTHPGKYNEASLCRRKVA